MRLLRALPGARERRRTSEEADLLPSSVRSHRSKEARGIDRIEIPLIQRDYAQGRRSDPVNRIRSQLSSTPSSQPSL